MLPSKSVENNQNFNLYPTYIAILEDAIIKENQILFLQVLGKELIKSRFNTTESLDIAKEKLGVQAYNYIKSHVNPQIKKDLQPTPIPVTIDPIDLKGNYKEVIDFIASNSRSSRRAFREHLERSRSSCLPEFFRDLASINYAIQKLDYDDFSLLMNSIKWSFPSKWNISCNSIDDILRFISLAGKKTGDYRELCSSIFRDIELENFINTPEELYSFLTKNPDNNDSFLIKLLSGFNAHWV